MARQPSTNVTSESFVYSIDRLKRILDTVQEREEAWSDDPDERAYLQTQKRRCVEYISSHAWCSAVLSARLGLGVGGVVAVFLVEIDGAPSVDDWLWVITGDFPSAYVVIDETFDAVDALATYCDIMQSWAEAVMTDDASAETFPVDAPRTKDNASDLLHRIKTLREVIIPEFRIV